MVPLFCDANDANFVQNFHRINRCLQVSSYHKRETKKGNQPVHDLSLREMQLRLQGWGANPSIIHLPWKIPGWKSDQKMLGRRNGSHTFWQNRQSSHGVTKSRKKQRKIHADSEMAILDLSCRKWRVHTKQGQGCLSVRPRTFAVRLAEGKR